MNNVWAKSFKLKVINHLEGRSTILFYSWWYENTREFMSEMHLILCQYIHASWL